MGLSVQELIDDGQARLQLRLHTGEKGLAREITVPRIQKPGLALTGYREQLHDERLLTLGGTELSYLESISEEARQVAYSALLAAKPACIVVTRGLSPDPQLAAVCESHGVPLLVSSLVSSEFIFRVTTYLQRRLAPTDSVHGVLVDVLEVGILLLGKSGIGKSEAALDLVVRGHRLVADDVVSLTRRGDEIVGGSNPTLGHHMEIRGLGIINIADLFGITAIRERKTVHLVAELSMWSDDADYDRLGVDPETHDVLGVQLPLMRIPVRPGRNISTIIEVAARNQLLRDIGHYSARNLVGSLDAAAARGRTEK